MSGLYPKVAFSYDKVRPYPNNPSVLSLRRSRRRLRQSKTMKYYWVYIMTNTNNTVFYTGVTNDLERRVAEHKDKKGSSFASKYNVTKLVFYERFDRVYDAIGAEKRIKSGSRAKKIEIIEKMNPNWQDLYDQKIATAFQASQ